MKEIRLLDSTNFSDVNALLKLDRNGSLAFNNYFLDSTEPDYRSYGIYKAANLISVISIIVNKEIPAYTISRAHSEYSADQTLLDIIKLEEPTLKQFFTLTAPEEFHGMQHLLYQYQPYVEHIVAAGTLTGYENIDHDVLSYKKPDVNMTVYLWVLKNEYRTV